MVRVAEPTKICMGPLCSGARKPWSEFYPRSSWPDGSMRAPRAHCKRCDTALRRERRHNDPEMQRAARNRAYERTKADPEKWAERMAYLRDWKRQRYGHVPRRRMVSAGGPLVSSVPFAAWLREVMARDGATQRDLAERFGVSDRSLYAILREGRDVELATVERALIADGTTMLWELYPAC